MDTREQARDALSEIFDDHEVTMRMVRRITRQKVVANGVADISRKWEWKYHESTLRKVLQHAYNEFGPTYEAVRAAELAFHGARNSKQVFENLHQVILERKLAQRRVPKGHVSTLGGAFA